MNIKEQCKKLILVIAGMPGSGKSIVSDIARKLDLPVIVLGDVVRDEVIKRGLKPTLKNMLSIAEELRRKYGPAAIAMLSIEKIRKINKNIIVIDGIRCLDEITYLKNALNYEILILAIHSSPRTRFERLKNRGRPGDPKSWEEFVERDFRELSWGIGNVIALADRIIVNEGGLDEFISAVTRFLSEVIEKWCSSELK